MYSACYIDTAMQNPMVQRRVFCMCILCTMCMAMLHFFCWYIYTEPGVPTVTATVSRDTAVIVKLTPAQTFDLIEQGLVSIRPTTGSDATSGTTEAVVNVSGSVLSIEGLLPGTEYSYRVAAMNGAGRSNFTEWVRFTTTATGE